MIKERWHKLDERIPVLVKKYPMVAGSMVFVGFLLGFVIGKLL